MYFIGAVEFFFSDEFSDTFFYISSLKRFYNTLRIIEV